jgi:hypothetical protein
VADPEKLVNGNEERCRQDHKASWLYQNKGRIMDEFWIQGQRKIIRKKLFKCAVGFLFTGFLVGIGLGEWWRITKIEPQHQAEMKLIQENHQTEIKLLQKRINDYRENWTPIKQLKKGIGKHKSEKIMK